MKDIFACIFALNIISVSMIFEDLRNKQEIKDPSRMKGGDPPANVQHCKKSPSGRNQSKVDKLHLEGEDSSV